MMHSHEIERALLASCFVGGYQDAAAVVTPDSFHRHAHRLIWLQIAKLAQKNQEIDPLEISAGLGSKLSECGGTDYLADILTEAFTKHNAGHLAHLVRDMAERRQTVEAAQRIISKAQDPDSSIDEVRAVRSSISEIESGYNVPFYDLSEIPMRDGKRKGISTGFGNLDALISTGGFPAGQMTIVSAYQKGGKTSLKLSSFMKLLESGKRCLFATFADLGREDIKERCVRNLCGWSHAPERSLEAQAAFVDAVNTINQVYEGKIYDASDLDSGDDIETFSAWFTAQHSKTPFDVVFLDYAQKITTSDRKAANALETAAIVSRKICKLAARTKVAFVVGSQITEGNQREGRKAITKGSRVWEEDGGWVLRIHEDKQIEIAFSRFGPMSGKDPLMVPMTWNTTNLRFEE